MERKIKENSGVQSKNNEYHIVNKVENVFVYTYIFDLIDNVVFAVFALYSRIHVVCKTFPRNFVCSIRKFCK
jgi:hypothetical protein